MNGTIQIQRFNILDPVYCDVIVNRFEVMTNTKAVRPSAGGK